MFDVLQHEAEYRLFMEAVKGSQGEKRLASQFLTRFFKHFPGLARDAINAMFDLCEDNDINVRMCIFLLAFQVLFCFILPYYNFSILQKKRKKPPKFSQHSLLSSV